MLNRKSQDYQNNTTNLDQSLLVDEGIERAVLCSLMAEPTKMIECSIRLKPEDFVNENNKYLYKIMLSLFNKNAGKPLNFDLSTLYSIAQRSGAEEVFSIRSGGKDYIEYLNIVKSSMIDSSNIESYIETLVNLSLKRKLFQTSDDFKKIILDSDLSPEELMVAQQNTINNVLINSSNKNKEFSKLSENIDVYIEKALTQKKKILGLETGFPIFDKYIEGLQKKTLTIVCAPKKTGKTAFLMNIGVNIGVIGKIPTLMISTEMSDERIMTRTISNISGVQEVKIRKGFLSSEELQDVNAAKEILKQGKFYHITMRAFNLEKLIGTIRKFVYNIVGFNEDGSTKDCLILFDYIKLPQGDTSNYREVKEYKVLSMIADGLKILSGDLDIPIVTACQTNRMGEVANSFELTWFCDIFAELAKKSKKEIERDQINVGYLGNQKLKITANRSGEENHEGIHFDYNGSCLKYIEINDQNAIKKQ